MMRLWTEVVDLDDHRDVRRYLDRQLLQLDPCTSFFTLARLVRTNNTVYAAWD